MARIEQPHQSKSRGATGPAFSLRRKDERSRSTRSWWVGLTREAFQTVRAAEDPRMRAGDFGDRPTHVWE